jgi:hypothetical protein
VSKKAETREALLESIYQTHEQLEKKFSKLTPTQLTWPGSMDDWSVKDILAHLADWEQRFISWYKAGLEGIVPEIPAPGMTWRDLAKLNQAGYERHKNETWDEVLSQFRKSYQECLALIEDMTNRVLFEPGVYEWTGKSSLLPWIVANTSDHYTWASKNIRTKVLHNACPVI